jgi:3-oxoacyl-[acyl-carrier protein] reductase
VLSLIGDLTNRSFIEEALALVLEAWGKVDVLVANIGSGRTSTGWQADPEDWIPVYQKNLFGSVRLIHAALPHLIKSGQGSIFLVSSIAGIEATQAPLSYGSAKAALLHYGKNLAREVASEGVRVNVVAPGNILFPGGSWESRLEKNRDAVESYIRSEVPLKRFGRPEEIADFVVFLCSARASFATGMVLPIDGGQTRSL